MTVMLLALMFSDSALIASEVNDYRIVKGREPESHARAQLRVWTPGIESWTIENNDCPAVFQREVKGFGTVRIGPSCVREEVPYAL